MADSANDIGKPNHGESIRIRDAKEKKQTQMQGPIVIRKRNELEKIQTN